MPTSTHITCGRCGASFNPDYHSDICPHVRVARADVFDAKRVERLRLSLERSPELRDIPSDQRYVYDTLTFTPVLAEFIAWDRIGERSRMLYCNMDVRRLSDGGVVITLWGVK